MSAGLPAPARRPLRRPAGGFTFIEMLFAIMLLGIGFILIAAMLPLGAIQSQETVDQTVAAQIAKGAAEAIQSIADSRTIPSTYDDGSGLTRNWGSARVFSFGDAEPWQSSMATSGMAAEYAKSNWQLVRGKMIYTADPRYAWTVLFSREWHSTLSEAPSYAQVFIVVCRIQIRDRYTELDLRGTRPNLRPREVYINLYEGSFMQPPGPDIIEFAPLVGGKPARPNSGVFSGQKTEEAVAEGTFVVISDDNQETARYKYWPTSSDTNMSGLGLSNGRVYRVGRPRPDLGANRWELAPGWDMPTGMAAGGPGRNLVMLDSDPLKSDNSQEIPMHGSSTPMPARALIVGRASVDPVNAVAFEGPAQDIAVFTTFIPVIK